MRHVFANQVADGKFKEITVIPKAVELFELQNAVLCIDAMGCQRRLTRSPAGEESFRLQWLVGDSIRLPS